MRYQPASRVHCDQDGRYPARVLYDLVIEHAYSEGYSLSVLDVHRLAYLSYALHMRSCDQRPTIEPAIAMCFGATIGQGYELLRPFGFGAVNYQPGALPVRFDVDSKLVRSVEAAWDRSMRNGLVEAAHGLLAPGTPWHAAFFRIGYGLQERVVIPDVLTKAFIDDPTKYSSSSLWLHDMMLAV